LLVSSRVNKSQDHRQLPRDAGFWIEAGRKLARVQTFLWYLILASLILILVRYLINIVSPPKEITFAPLTVVGTNSKPDGSVLAGVMSSKLQQLKDRRESPVAGYGFLQIPTMVIPDPVGAHPNGVSQRLEDLNLKIKDVEVNAVTKVLRALFAPPEAQLKGTVTELAATLEIDCQLIRGNEVRASWHSSRAKVAGKDEEVLDGLLDDILFQFLYDLPRSERLKEWRSSADPDRFPNWRTMEDFVRGLEWLSEYQHNLDHESLIKAQNQLQRLQIVAPNFTLGLYFYGIALAENRKEAQAAEVFQQAKNQVDGEESVRLNARLQEAGARLRLYETEEAKGRAVPLLQSLINDLKIKLNASALSPATRTEYEQLMALAYAQLAYSYGTITELTADTSWTAKAETALADADALVKPHEKDWSDTNINEIRFRIWNARGYSMFRTAQHSSMAPKEFRVACDEAIKVLQDARRLRPNHYEVLQNLALIYDDEKYDPSLNSLDYAESLYKQTSLFVPEDYYQYERLGRIEFRRMLASPLAQIKRSVAQKGAKYISQALAIRNESREANLLAAVFAGELWTTESDEAARKAGAKAFRESLDAAINFNFRSEHKSELLFCQQTLKALLGDPGGEDVARLNRIDTKVQQIIQAIS
jgi:hypothetical protein